MGSSKPNPFTEQTRETKAVAQGLRKFQKGDGAQVSGLPEQPGLPSRQVP